MGNKQQQSVCSLCDRYESVKTAEENLLNKNTCKTRGCYSKNHWKKIGYRGEKQAKAAQPALVIVSPSEKAFRLITSKLNALSGELSVESTLSNAVRLKTKKDEAVAFVTEHASKIVDVSLTVKLLLLLNTHTRKTDDKWCFLRVERNNFSGKLLNLITTAHIRTPSTEALGNTNTYETIWQVLRDQVSQWYEGRRRTLGETDSGADRIKIQDVLCMEYRAPKTVMKSKLKNPMDDPIYVAKCQRVTCTEVKK